LLKRAYRLLYRNNLDFKTAIAEIEKLAPGDDAVMIFSEFLRRSERGVIRR
jgi:acyl-[acyl carrier protein]--UDP-N-acetylglucosamine O-acyltransferase